MGEAYQLDCKQCSYNHKVFLGIGFNYINLKTILGWYKQEEGRQQIKKYMNEEDVYFECYDGLYVCEQCGYLLNRPFLHIISKDYYYINNYDCPRCHVQMPQKPLLDEIEEISLKCPDCEKEKLEIQAYMDWD
ncbi:hypothetical protein [Paenibacillus xylanexedens]|uniref:hypothetical protein n=1 Tax=Paenibacillus xylanexedens TaxID=528191 RepID=UPI000F52260D|nr:hypothetical protein [Paenibacillus xylanexedens]